MRKVEQETDEATAAAAPDLGAEKQVRDGERVGREYREEDAEANMDRVEVDRLEPSEAGALVGVQEIDGAVEIDRRLENAERVAGAGIDAQPVPQPIDVFDGHWTKSDRAVAGIEGRRIGGRVRGPHRHGGYHGAAAASEPGSESRPST